MNFTIRRGCTVLGDGSPRDCSDHAPRGDRDALEVGYANPAKQWPFESSGAPATSQTKPALLRGRVDPGVGHAHAKADAAGDPDALRQRKLAGRIDVDRAEQLGPVREARALQIAQIRPDIAALVAERVAGT